MKRSSAAPRPLASIAAFAALATISAPALAQAPSETSLVRPAAADLAAASLAPRAPRLTPAEPIPPAELEAFVDATVRLGMDDAHVAGVTVSIVQDGVLVLEKGYGFASFDPVRPVDPATTLFRIGSISKTFTWIEVMRAVEAGKLDLDAAVNEYLPEDLQIPDEGFSRPIRVRDLLTHSAGFEDRVLGVLFAADASKILPLREFLARYRPRRVREPGILSSYSNYGAALAGAIVAEIEGTAWEDLIERDIIAPLGLTHVTGREPYPKRDGLPAPLPDALAADLSEPFRWNGSAHDARSFEHVTQIAPAGAMSASARDMARYMLLLLGDGTLDGVTVFGPDAARAFRTPLTRLPPEAGALDAGFFDTMLPGGFHGYGHGGATLSFFSNLTVVPDLDLGIFVSTNTEGGNRISDALAARVVERFYGAPRPAPAIGRADPAAAAAARVYAGNYLSTRRRYSGLEGFVMRIGNQMSVSVAPDGQLLIGGRRFAPTGVADTFAGVGSPLGQGDAMRFERDGDRVVRIAMVPIAFERVSTLYSRPTLIVAAMAVLVTTVGLVVGFFSRLGRGLPASAGQTAAGSVQLAAAVLWLACAAALAVFGVGAADTVTVVYGWPGALQIASAFALGASALTLVNALMLPAVWRGSVGGAGWAPWRKARYTAALAIFALFVIVLGAWGALEPWSY